MEIAVWPSTGGRRNNHSPAGLNRNGWRSFTTAVYYKEDVRAKSHFESPMVSQIHSLGFIPPSLPIADSLLGKFVEFFKYTSH